MGRTLVIADIHGCYDTFRYLIEELVLLKSDDQLYLLEDYIDRGPNSKGIIDYIISREKI